MWEADCSCMRSLCVFVVVVVVVVAAVVAAAVVVVVVVVVVGVVVVGGIVGSKVLFVFNGLVDLGGKVGVGEEELLL